MLDKDDAAQAEEVISDFFAFQAAACTAQPDCQCGRDEAWHRQAYADEVADGLQSDPAYDEWAEAMRAADAGAWDEA